MTSALLIDGDRIVAADKLSLLPVRAHDYERESRALDRLIARINQAPDRALAALTDVTVDLIGAGSAGVSLMEGDHFRWPAISGALAGHAKGGLPVDASPCGVVVAHDRSLLFTDPHLLFTNIDAEPRVREVLLVPLRFAGRAEGTLWAISHDERRFDSEDARILERLALFAAAIEDARRARLRLAQPGERTQHRTAETMWVIRSVVRRASEEAEEAQNTGASELVYELGDRMLAYGTAAQASTSPGGPSNLWSLLAEILRQVGELPGTRVAVDGPDVDIHPRHAGLVALALRELLDNAFAHGALAHPEGAVHVRWQLEPRASGRLLRFSWTESGMALDPTIAHQPGFGFDLLLCGLPEQTGADTRVELLPRGLVFTMTLPHA